ncbi:NHX3 [Symbiodinium sp. CCMP2592]|nr:NHX3 [Symbiodinium sp. CCMP2592]
MPLGTSNMLSPWSCRVDASLTGYAVCAADLSGEEARQLVHEDERWRFYRGDGERLAPRIAALDTSAVFDEVSGEVLREDRWHQLWNSRFHHKDPRVFVVHTDLCMAFVIERIDGIFSLAGYPEDAFFQHVHKFTPKPSDKP